MTKYDPRVFAHRTDLADESLQGRIEAANFVTGTKAQIRTPVASIRKRPEHDAPQLTEALMGENLTVFEVKDGWAWVKLETDGYVGYMDAVALRDTVLDATHEVPVPSTVVYPKPDLKTQPAHHIPMLARLTVIGQDKDYLALASGGYVFANHVRPINAGVGDYVDVAERFLFAPYYWGGKTIRGLDCSGLVQVALNAVGWPCLRDSDMQEQSLGKAVAPGSALLRGDLVFWDGHVGIMADAKNLLHANGHHMMVAIEPLEAAVKRIAATGKSITSIKRL